MTSGTEKFYVALKGFAKEGVAEGRLESTGYGSGNPVADNCTEDGRAPNRRVELVIVTGQI